MQPLEPIHSLSCEIQRGEVAPCSSVIQRIRVLSSEILQLERDIQSLQDAVATCSSEDFRVLDLKVQDKRQEKADREKIKKILQQVKEGKDTLAPLFRAQPSSLPKDTLDAVNEDFQKDPTNYVLYYQEGKMYAEKKGTWTWIKQHLLSKLCCNLWREYRLCVLADISRKSSVLHSKTLIGINQLLIEHNKKKEFQQRIPLLFQSIAYQGSTKRELRILWPHLIEEGVLDVNAKNSNDLTLLMLATLNRDTDMIQYLKRHGADLDCADKDGWTALELSLARGFDDVSNLLIELGANERLSRNAILTNFTAHIWEIGGKVTIEDGRNHSLERSLEGNFRKSMQMRFIEYSRQFFNSEEPVLQQHATVMQSLRALRKTEVLEAIQNGWPFLMPIGVTDHCISLVFHGNQLFLCNRGDGMSKNAIEIYSFDPSKVTEEHIRTLRDSEKSIQDVHRLLKEFGAIFTGSIHQNPQTVGNCTWANIESGFYAFTYTLAEGDDKSKREEAKLIHKRFRSFAKVRSLEEYLQNVTPPSIPFLKKILVRIARKKLQICPKKREELQSRIKQKIIDESVRSIFMKKNRT